MTAGVTVAILLFQRFNKAMCRCNNSKKKNSMRERYAAFRCNRPAKHSNCV